MSLTKINQAFLSCTKPTRGSCNVDNAHKRLKATVNTTTTTTTSPLLLQPNSNRGWTPFDTLNNFEPNVLVLINDYFSSRYDQDLEITHLHWFVAYGLSTDYTTAFQHALKNNNLSSIKYLLSQGADLSFRNSINEAVRLRYLNVPRFLISLCPHIVAWKNNALNNAVGYAHLDVVQFLLSMGVEVTAFNKAIQTACSKGHLEIVKFLVSTCVDAKAKQAMVTADDNKAIQEASEYGHLEIVKFLVSTCVDAKAKQVMVSANNNEAVFLATWNGHLDTVKYLVSQGADILAHGDGLISEAAYNNDLDTVIYLGSQGVKITESILGFLEEEGRLSRSQIEDLFPLKQ